MSTRYCTLNTGAAIFYEQFEGVEGLKDRYFLVITDRSPSFECFTTTTKLHAESNPRLAGECCLPKRCFVDFRKVYEFDDIQLGNWLASRRVRHVGDLPLEVLTRIHESLGGCRQLSATKKNHLLQSLASSLS